MGLRGRRNVVLSGISGMGKAKADSEVWLVKLHFTSTPKSPDCDKPKPTDKKHKPLVRTRLNKILTKHVNTTIVWPQRCSPTTTSAKETL